MRAVLILVNVLLAIWLLAAIAGHMTGGPKAEELSVKKGGGKKGAASAAASAAKNTVPPSLDSRMATVIDNNIFNSDRCPNATFGRGRSNRIELTLVGTFEIDGVKGAIIKQKGATANTRNNFMGMGGMGGMPGAGRWGGRNNTGSNANTRSAVRVQLVDGVWRNFGGTDAVTQQQQQQQAVTLRQYVRVGETLSNGYTLAEVSRAGAVLTRGSDKMELELQDPSQGLATASTNTQRRTNVFQQMQQMQQMQMQQNFQMMRMMQRTLQNQNQGGNTGNRGGTGGGGMGGPGGPPPGR